MMAKGRIFLLVALMLPTFSWGDTFKVTDGFADHSVSVGMFGDYAVSIGMFGDYHFSVQEGGCPHADHTISVGMFGDHSVSVGMFGDYHISIGMFGDNAVCVPSGSTEEEIEEYVAAAFVVAMELGKLK